MNLTEENVAPYAGSEQRIEEVSQKFDLRESVYGRRESLLLRGVMGLFAFEGVVGEPY